MRGLKGRVNVSSPRRKPVRRTSSLFRKEGADESPVRRVFHPRFGDLAVDVERQRQGIDHADCEGRWGQA